MTLFASYSRADHAAIGPLLDDIRALGYDVWLDEELSGGQVWWDEILAKIRGCDAFLFLLTPSSVDSEACLLELGYADALDRTIVPVELVATDPVVVPSALGKYQIVRYGGGDKSAMIAVSRALSQVERGRPLPDPEPPRPPLPGSYFTTLRDEVNRRDTLTLEQQLGLLHRVRVKADDPTAYAELEQLLTTFRRRDDLFASVAEQIDALRATLVPPVAAIPVVHGERLSRFRSPHEMLDRFVIALGALAVSLGLIAMFGSLYRTDREADVGWGASGHELRRWQLIVFLVVFAALIAWSFTRSRWARLTSSLLVILVALYGVVGWWFPAIDELVAQTYISVDHIGFGPGIIFTGFSLGLQVVVGVLMLAAALTPDGKSVR
jgi:hypothetical protein